MLLRCCTAHDCQRGRVLLAQCRRSRFAVEDLVLGTRRPIGPASV